MLDDVFAAFRARQRELAADESCGCRACRSMGRLDLKIIAHHGRFLRQMVGDRSQAAGVDVILAHRMLKNGVTGSDYALLTRPAFDRMDLDPVALGLAPHTESYEHFGDVECYVESVAEAGC